MVAITSPPRNPPEAGRPTSPRFLMARSRPKPAIAERTTPNSMIATPAIRNLIRENKTHQIPSMIQTSAQHGMMSMDQCLRDLYMKGYIKLEDAMRRAMNTEELKKMINTPQTQSPSGPARR